jgi:hypothetical protein
MIPEITNPEDWQNVELMLRNTIRNMPGFYHDFYALTKNVDKMIKELSLIDIELRKRYSKTYSEKRIQKLKEINGALRIFSKMHLLATLSKR